MDWAPPDEQVFNNQWLTPDEAVGLLVDMLEIRDRRRWIFNRLKVGEIIAVARSAYRNGANGKRFFGIPVGFWRGVDHLDNYFWDSGDVDFEVYAPRTIPDTSIWQCHDVRFDPESFSGVPPKVRPREDEAEADQSKAPEPPRNMGGRPPKLFWEDMLVEIFDQLWHGALVPKTQADIENAMSSWLSSNDYDASERAVRQRAQKLWKVWIKEGNN